jgi:SAM-dependent methyltransferase
MLDFAASRGTARDVEWRQADALALPFADQSFDVVVCQFAAMFFPDRAKAYSEARRVLRDEGMYIFSVWDRIEENEFADVVTESLRQLFPEDPPRFLARVPHGYYDFATIADDLQRAGFAAPFEMKTIAHRSLAKDASVPAIAYCQGTPLRNEIEQRDATRLEEATAVAAEALARRFGSRDLDGKIQAHVIAVRK